MVMLWTPLAFGVTMLLCFTIFFFYCWRMRHSRTHAALTSSSIQVSATIPAAAAADSSQQQQLPVSTHHSLLSLFEGIIEELVLLGTVSALLLRIKLLAASCLIGICVFLVL